MSYMNRKNILSEGFFDNLKKLFKRQPKMTKQDKELMKDPEYKKAYMDALKSKIFGIPENNGVIFNG